MTTPSYAATAKRMRRIARKHNPRHGPLGVAVPATSENAEGWTGPVVRLEDLTDEQRVAIGGRARTDPAYRPAGVGICPCPICGHWRDESPVVKCSTCGVFSLAQR